MHVEATAGNATPGPARLEIQALFDSIGDGAILTDEFGRITRINPTALKILGYTKEELIGQWFPKVIVSLNEQGKPQGLIDRPISRAFLTGKSISEKLLYRRKDGQPVSVAITVSPMIMNGRPVGAVEVFRDITLEQEIDRMKSEFISLASHQLRTPLSAIKTYSHMLVDGFMGPLEPPQKKALRTIIGASNRMNELISTLLNITRMEAGSIAVSPKYVNLGRLLDEIHHELQHTARNKEINFTLKLPQYSVAVRTDPLILKEIISNLATNALKYTPPEGSVELSLAINRSRAVVAVKDNGLGIPRASHDQIFTKFFRAPNVVKRETTGTGLGLYLVRGLADVLNGKVWFDSDEGKGSTFYFSIHAQRIPKKVKM
jgi:PAS domain S-box-containing protein